MKIVLGLLSLIVISASATQLGVSSKTPPIIVEITDVTKPQQAQDSAFHHAQHVCSGLGRRARLTRNSGHQFYFDCVDRSRTFPFSELLNRI